ncbi:MAG: peptide ABC transporter substrate-binding protein [Bdellovibrionaceae bacterium]|nr:peptide ABC transporter substrate-binding protein [Pseudobdellovibrionaceae bacterium]
MKAINILSIILAVFLSMGCTKKKKGDYDLDPKETFVVNITSEPPSLDWNKSTDTTSALIQDNIMEGLLEYNFDDPDLGLKGSLAKNWSPNEDATKWTFELKKDVKWIDGIEVTAQQFADGWERLLNPLTASEYSYFLYSIKNAREYNQGKIKDFSEVGIKVTGPHSLEVTLVGPQSYFPYLLTHHSTYPIRKDVIKKHGDKWTDPENIVTNGPFRLKVWDHDKAIILERNEIYYGEKPKFKNILAYMIPEMSTAINLFDKGQIDAQLVLPSTELPVLKKRAEHLESGILSLYYFGFNVKKKPMDNPLVRKAISHAINRNEVTKMMAGGQIPLTSWVPPGMFGYEAEIGTSFDIEKANKLLDDAGFKDRSKLPTITLGFNTNENHQRIAENIQSQLKKNLGINVELKNEEWKVYLNTIKMDPPHIFRMGWLADYPDPDNFLNLMTSYSDNNHTQWGNKDFDELIEKAAKELDKGKRKEYYSTAQKILTEIDVPVAPVFSSVVHSLVSKRVKNFPNNSMNRYEFKGIELK